jgi:sugar transferase (PEP-CTERM/EpsH1 system associated)
MANILYLVHRLPYPPNKGDKVRSYHLLRHLQKHHRVFLGTFVDHPDDEQHVATLARLCPDLHVERLSPPLAKLKSLQGLLSGQALSLAYYRSAGMQRWVHEVAASHALQSSVVFSSSMAQFAQPLLPAVPMLVDFVDVDSAKWTAYVPQHRWPMSWVYAREGCKLLAYERAVTAQARQAFFVTPNEVALFLQSAPEGRGRVASLCNGVDADFFSPDPAWPSPYGPDERAVVFTGAMDYWPNIDAAVWFATEAMPALRQRHPDLRFYIVGRDPAAKLQALAGEHTVVTGTVPDVRPYLQHAAAVVAPLRVARGIQNKILEAMAMAQPVVTVPGCAEAIGATDVQGLLRAEQLPAFVEAADRLLGDPTQTARLGEQAREFVLAHFSWNAHLRGIDRFIESTVQDQPHVD